MENNRKWMLIDWAVIIFLTLVPAYFPIFQYVLTEGSIFIENAYDEYHYLTYDKSLRAQGITRVSQFLVTFLHELGFSAGEINLLFDCLLGFASLVLTRLIFLQLKLKRGEATQATFLMFSLPFIFGRSFPPWSRLFDWNISSGGFHWINMSEGYYLPFHRSPEPQFSIFLILLGTFLSLRLKKFWVLISLVPFLYFSVQIPFAFVVGSLVLFYGVQRYSKNRSCWTKYGVMILVYIGMAVAIWAMWELALKESTMGLLLGTGHGPLLSVTSIACLMIYFWKRYDFPEQFHFPLLVLAWAPMAVSNLQVIAGVFSQPAHFEHSFGVLCFSILVIFAFLEEKKDRNIQYGLLSLGFFLIFGYWNVMYQTNKLEWYWKPLPAAVLNALKDSPDSVVLGDYEATRKLHMLFPRQQYSPMSYQGGLVLKNNDSLKKYLCARKFVRENAELNNRMKPVLNQLDRLYENRGVNFILLHLERGRKKHIFKGVDAVPQNCPQINYQVFFLE